MPPDDFCVQEPGVMVFEPAEYWLQFYDVQDRDGYLFHFQASTPFPSFHKDDKVKTVCWPLKDQKGKPCVVEEVYHNVWSTGNKVTCLTSVYCRFG